MTIDQQIELIRLRSELEKSNRVGAALADQLQRSIARNSRYHIALEQIARKEKMDAVAAVAMRAIARDAIKGNDNAD